MVGSSYSKFKSKDSGKGRNFEGVSGNPSMPLLPPLLPLGILFAVSSWLKLRVFQITRCCSISKSFIDSINLISVLNNSWVKFAALISPNKLRIIGFCLSNFEIYLNTISY